MISPVSSISAISPHDQEDSVFFVGREEYKKKFIAAKNRNTFLKIASLISISVLAVMILTDLFINQGSCLKTFLKNPMKMNHFIKNPFTITASVTAVSLLGCAISTKDKIVKYKEYKASIAYDNIV